MEFGIIGASHYFEFVVDGQVLFAEIFACIDDKELFDDCLINGLSFDANINFQHNLDTSVGHIKYSFFYNVKSKAENYKEFEIFVEKAKVSGLLFEFPSLDRKDDPPVTAIYVVSVVYGFEINTIHYYPNEDGLVFTTTLVQIL